MKITFLNYAYVAIGYNTTYTGRFVQVAHNTFVEKVDGEEMTLAIPAYYTTVGHLLTAK